MSLKEFDAKQFLLEKGERVGLGVAVGLMVLMLIFSLFMPSNGFFSGSPAAKAAVLKTGTEQLETALRTRTPSDNDKPEKREGGMPDLDKSLLDPDNYEALAWFEPSIKESPARRPPKILNVVEAVAEVSHVLIDTYLFDKDFAKVWILDDKKGGTSAGGNNPFGSMYNRGAGGMGMGPQMGGNFFRQNQSRLRNNFNPGALQGVGADDKAEYEPKLVSTENWNPQQQLTAHQPRPLRVAVIAGSFPYREQLEEFKRQLRLADTDAVLAETIDAEEDKPNAFRFLGVKVQRADVDENGKTGNWSDLPLAETYELWLKHTSYPLQPESSKYDLVKYPGLVAPLLREFHADRANDLGAAMPFPGLPGLGNAAQAKAKAEEAADELKTNYPDPAAKLPKLQETLEKLQGVQAKKIAAPKSKSKRALFDPWNPPNTLSSDNNAVAPDASADKDSTVPDYCLMRFVDVNLQAGKHYRYRFKIRMANPNYQRSDVASPDYKKNKELESKEWFPVKETVAVPPELYYYVADDKPAGNVKRADMPPPQSARNLMWKSSPHTDQVVFQFQRWVEATPISRREGDVLPVGDWAVADRVFVSRGENVGRRVRVDLPIWKYVQNAYVLPTEEQQKSRFNRRTATTGIDVDFGQDNPERDTILVDFEGGKVSAPPKMYDTCRLEVLMLSPDGKLLARNNAADTTDEDRLKRRQEALDRIKEIREGKAAQ